MQLILYMMFAIRCFLTNACNCTTLDAAKVDSTFFFSTCCIFLRIQIAEYNLFLWGFFYQKFLWMRNIFRLALPKNQIKLLWHFFKNVTPNSIGYNSCHFSGVFFNLWDLWQIHSNQETRHLFGVKTKMSRFVIDFEGLAYTDKMNAINRFQCSSWASPILAMAIFKKNWRDDIQMWRKLNFWWPLKCKFFLVIVFLLPTRLFIRSLCVHSITTCNRKSCVALVHTTQTYLDQSQFIYGCRPSIVK